MVVSALLLSRVCGLCGVESQSLILIGSSLLSGSLTILALFLFGLVHWPLPHFFAPLSQYTTYRIVFFAILVLLGLNSFFELFELPDVTADSMLEFSRHPLGIFSLVILGPFVEELVFREAMLGGMLRRGVPVRVAIFCSALAFGLIHANPAQIPYAFLVGLLLGFLYCHYRSLTLPVVIHIANNGLAVFLMCCFGKEASLATLLDSIPLRLVISLLLCASGLWGIYASVLSKK